MTSPSSPRALRPLPSLRRRVLLGAGVAALPAAALAAGTAPARAEDPVDPAVTGGETRIQHIPLADVPTEEVAGIGTARLVEQLATMAGCRWDGGEAPEHVSVRGRAADGSWGEWYELHIALDPDSGTPISGTDPAWLGPVDAVQVVAERGGADVAGELTAHVVTTSPASKDAELPGAVAADPGAVGSGPGDDGGVSGPGGGTSRVGTVGAEPTAAARTLVVGPNCPTFVTRAGWGADESLAKDSGTHSETQAIVLHHTEGSNSYAASESAQIIRGILAYHTKSNGWADIGYNAFVDKYGVIYEGRRGGLSLNITGAHARGYNSRTFGISVLGSFTSIQASPGIRAGVADIASWRLISAFHPQVDEKSPFLVTETGTAHPKGTTVNLPRFFGHRDVNLTDCPGTAMWRQQDQLRADVQWRMDNAWRVHLDAFTRDGGASRLGTVTEVAHTEGRYTATVLTKALIISEGGGPAVTYGTTFGRSWTDSWGRPVEAARTVDGVELQRFEGGTAVREGSTVTFVTTRFRDVPRDMAFRAEIETLAAKGITTGYPDLTYRPFQPIGRDAMIAFIYRAKGSPAFTPPARSPFTDLTPSTQFYREICWAVSQGITTGFPDGTFRPTLPVERQAVAAFLHRASGSPAVPSGAPTFPDVPRTSQFHAAISWLAAQRITTGFPDGTFRPETPINRDAMAAFVVRWMTAVGL